MATQGMLAKVRALLENAESYETQASQPHTCATCTEGATNHREDARKAAETFRAKADELIIKYRLEEEMQIAQDPTSMEPVLVPVTVLTSLSNPFQQDYINLYWTVADHAGVRVHFGYGYGDSGQRTLVAETVGYETDVRYVEMLFTMARVVFSEKLEPKLDRNLGDQVNVYRLRSAGMERVRVAELVWGNREKSSLAKVGRMYKAECTAREEKPALDGRGVTGKVYREQYAKEFVRSLGSRLRRLRDAAGSFGGGLVLHGRKERVEEAFYTFFPNYRPTPALPAGEPKPCEACKATKHESKQCKDHRPRSLTKKDLAAADRYYSPAAMRGREAGTTAAMHVALTRDHRGNLEA